MRRGTRAALDDELQGLLRTTALDLLDDVARLARLVATVPGWPSWPGVAFRPPHDAGAPAVYAAVDDLADYSHELGAIAIVLVNREARPRQRSRAWPRQRRPAWPVWDPRDVAPHHLAATISEPRATSTDVNKERNR